jgi:hypothetical protein
VTERLLLVAVEVREPKSGYSASNRYQAQKETLKGLLLHPGKGMIHGGNSMSSEVTLVPQTLWVGV